jgi:hypothetical protein
MSYNGRHSIVNVQPPPGPVGRPGYPEPWPPAPDGYTQPQPWHREPAKPRRRRRIFLWAFLAVQALFVFLVILQAASGGNIHAEAAAYCHAHPSQFLPFSQCVSDYGDGGKVGTAIGAGLLVVLWAVADIIMGTGYVVYRLAKRPSGR